MKERGSTVVVIDGGGRGSALVDKYAQSPHVKKIVAIPGNDLMQINTDKKVLTFPKVKTTDVENIVKIAVRQKADLVDVAQDNAVQAGVTNRLREKGMSVCGPTREAGQIEWDKAWARELGKHAQIPQPYFRIFTAESEGKKFIRRQKTDKEWFIKAAYLAEGKGALPAKDNQQALKKISELRKEFPEASQKYLIEEWVDGEEFSGYAVSDGYSFRIIGSAQDHKRVFNRDQGPNTGGMGCSSPPLVLTSETMKEVSRVFERTFSALYDEGRPYTGIMYLGGILAAFRKLLVIEFNARWGDPEAQVVLPSLLNDLFEVSMAVAKGDIREIDFKTDGKARVVVVGAAKGYPKNYKAALGKRIFGIDKASKMDGVKIYGAGVERIDGADYVAGGRLFSVEGEGQNIIDAREKAYDAMSLISIEDDMLHYREDIGWRDVKRLKSL